MIVSICKTHLSFITFILEDEHGLSLGILMHVKCIDEFCIFSHGFLLHIASYKGIIQCFIYFGVKLQSPPTFMELTLPVRNPVFYIFDVSGGKLSRNHLKICGGHFLGRRRLAGEGSMSPGWEIVHGSWSSISEKWGGIILKLSFGCCFTKTSF